MLGHFMKLNQGLIAPGQKQVTPLQAKLHYMKIVSELRSFGGKCFLATLVVSIVLWPILKYVQLNVHLLLCFERQQTGFLAKIDFYNHLGLRT